MDCDELAQINDRIASSLPECTSANATRSHGPYASAHSEALSSENVKHLESLTSQFTHLVDRPVGLEGTVPNLDVSTALNAEPPPDLSSAHVLLCKHAIFMPHAIVDLAEIMQLTDHKMSACIVAPQGLTGLVKQHHPTSRVIHKYDKHSVITTHENISSTKPSDPTALHLETISRIPSAPIHHPVSVHYIPARKAQVCSIYPAEPDILPEHFVRDSAQQAERSKEKFFFGFSGKINGTICEVLADSGCGMMDARFAGVIDKKLVDRLRLPIATAYGATCGGFNGSDTTVYGSVTCPLKIGKCTTIPLTFMVVDMENEVILGQEAMLRLKCILDFPNKTMTITDAQGQRHTVSNNGTPQQNLPKTKCLRISYKKARKIATSSAFICFLRVRKKEGEEDPAEDPRITALVEKYESVFDKPPDGEAHWRPGDPGFRIRTLPGSVPPARKPHRAFGANRKVVQDELDKLIKAGKIKPSNSPYGAPVLFVPKPDGTLRFCIDYRELNKQTIKDRHPLPHITDMLDAMEGATTFSTIDLTVGFYQVPVAPEDREKTAFVTHCGQFEYVVMPMGLCNAPSEFQRRMQKLLQPFLGKFAVVYIDDVLVFSKNMDEHLDHLEQIFKVMQDNQYYLKRTKCEFGLRSIAFLGHIISEDGVEPNPRKLEILKDWPVPTENNGKAELQSFLGLANFFRKFAFRYTDTVRPLQQLVPKDAPWEWGPAQQKAWDAVKTLLTEHAILSTPSANERFDVVVDACDYAIGGILIQNGKIVAYEGRKMTPQDMKYGVGEKELLAARYCMQQWKCYLMGTPVDFDLWTDHNPNTFFLTKKSLSPRQMRWYEDICAFNYNWRYKKGANNEADPISRSPQFHPSYTSVVNILRAHIAAVEAAPLDFDGVMGMSMREQIAAQSSNRWFSKKNPKDKPWTLDPVTNLWYTVDKQVVVPPGPDLRHDIMYCYHDTLYAGHQSAARTFRTIASKYYWPGQRTDVEDFVRRCQSCQRQKPYKGRKAPTQAIPVPDRLWGCIHVDFMIALPTTESGLDSIAVFIDKLSKLCHIVPFKNKGFQSPDFAKMFEDTVVRLHGVPDSIISDRDKLFTAEWWQQTTRDLKIRHHMSTAYHPQTDGATEKMNDVIESALRHYVNAEGTNWDQFLSGIEFAINNAVSESLGTSPFMLNYGFNPKMPVDAIYTGGKVPNAQQVSNELKLRWKRAREFVAHAQARYSDPHFVIPSFEVGDYVWLSTRNFRRGMPQGKHLSPRHVGPYKITHKRGKLAYTLNIPNTRKHTTFHFDVLKKHIGEPPVATPSIPRHDSDALADEYFEIDGIVKHRWHARRLQFLVRWKGYDNTHDTWIAQSKVTQCAQDEYKLTAAYRDCKAAIDEEKARKAASAEAALAVQAEQPQGVRRSSRNRTAVNFIQPCFSVCGDVKTQCARISMLVARYGASRGR
jgi:Reverse transcriptase (RNA-dependent DNA polymerase)/RNase H-like domain found in reverse transcriptase/Integrase zinc binding domain/Integrase core domain/Chromo (CHRromatin Organisation MOdifier) domain